MPECNETLFDLRPLLLRELIKGRLKPLAGSWLPEIADVAITPPTYDDFRMAYRAAGLLPMKRAQIQISPADGSEPLMLEVPAPHQGIFFLQPEDYSRHHRDEGSCLWTWCPWLTEGSGMRLVRGNTHRRRLSVRIGSGGGQFVNISLTDKAGNPLSKSKFLKQVRPVKPFIALQETANLPKEIKHIFTTDSIAVPILFPPTNKNRNKKWEALLEYGLWLNKSTEPTDLDDIEQSMLMTYTFWVAARVIERTIRVLLSAGPPENPSQGWDLLLNAQAAGRPGVKTKAMQAGLFPLKQLRKRGKLHAFRPTNPVDAISQLTQVKRYDIPRNAIEHRPPADHQNHPSFYGRLCPVETPESESLGISLHLAKGCRQDQQGRLIPCSREDHGLGWAASLIPFFEHNDAVRNMMGAKNLKQALPITGRTSPGVRTGEENGILRPTAILNQLEILPQQVDAHHNLALGTDLLVAYMPFFGLNFEDAIVASERLAKDDVLTYCKKEKLSFRLRPGLSLEPTTAIAQLLEDANTYGLAKAGTVMQSGDSLATFWSRRDAQPYQVRYDDVTPAELLDISLDYDGEFGGGCLNCKVRKNYIVTAGDKLMGRHGNKGVISELLPDGQMPRLPDEPKLPDSLRGKPIDLILNPHGVISRMNLGQLMETHLGWLHRALPQEKFRRLDFEVPAFGGQFPHYQEQMRQAFTDTGLDSAGRCKLRLPDGSFTEQPVVVGFQHIVRLKHIPKLKSQTRGHSINARYNLQTCQAVHGRKAGGGQRVGEMELWALSAHKAHNIISEMLYEKSDCRSFLQEAVEQSSSSTWNTIHDYLFAMGISADIKDGQVQFGWAPLEDSAWSSGEVLGENDTINSQCSTFECPRCGYSPCKTKIFHTEKYLKLKDLLFTFGLECPQTPSTWENTDTDNKGFNSYEATLDFPFTRKPGTRTGSLTCTERKTNISISLNIHAGHGEKELAITARGRKPSLGGKDRKTKTGFTADGIAGLADNPNLLPIGDMHVSCVQKHPSVELKPAGCKKTTRPAEQGLFDPAIFGEDPRKKQIPDSRKWGHIELPYPITYPYEILCPTRKQAHKDDNDQFPSNRNVPVLPMKYRCPPPGDFGPRKTPAINRKYRQLVKICNHVKRNNNFKTADKPDPALLKRLRNLVSEIFNDCLAVVKGQTSKHGLVRKYGMGRRVDCSGRLVIVPDPYMHPSRCRLPAHILWEIVKEDVVAWLRKIEFAGGPEHEHMSATQMRNTSEETPSMADGTDFKSLRFDILQHKILDARTAETLRSTDLHDSLLHEQCKHSLETFIAAYPHKRLILNRQPSLHKYSMMAFYPLVAPDGDGEVLHVSPLVCNAFGADFDGDEMTIHWPLSEDAHRDAQNMMFKNNLLSEANAQPLTHYAQDIVLGIYLLKRRGKETKLFELLPDFNSDTRCCIECLEGFADWDKEAGTQLIRHLCIAHPEKAEDAIWQISKCAFESATQAGVTLGAFDVTDSQTSDRNDEIINFFKQNQPIHGERAISAQNDFKVASNAINEQVENIFKSKLRAGSATPGYGMAAMAMSGARGRSQSKQLVSMRGFLDPGTVGFDIDTNRCFFTHSLAAETNRADYYKTVYNARSSMCDKKLGTGKAGWLTRQLVAAMWNITVSEGDCGQKGSRNPATCRRKNTVCKVCYGKAVDRHAPSAEPESGFYINGYPAGLIAAQSIGERGTQMSMQSFHTGERVFTPDSVKSLLNTPCFFDLNHFITAPDQFFFDVVNDEFDEIYRSFHCVQNFHDALKMPGADMSEAVLKQNQALINSLANDSDMANRLMCLLSEGFLKLFTSIPAYSKLLPRHGFLLWRTIHNCQSATLAGTLADLPPLAALAYCPIRQTLLHNASNALTDDLTHPASQIILGNHKWPEAPNA